MHENLACTEECYNGIKLHNVLWATGLLQLQRFNTAQMQCMRAHLENQASLGSCMQATQVLQLCNQNSDWIQLRGTYNLHYWVWCHHTIFQLPKVLINMQFLTSWSEDLFHQLAWSSPFQHPAALVLLTRVSPRKSQCCYHLKFWDKVI